MLNSGTSFSRTRVSGFAQARMDENHTRLKASRMAVHRHAASSRFCCIHSSRSKKILSGTGFRFLGWPHVKIGSRRISSQQLPPDDAVQRCVHSPQFR